jgi:cystinosin
LVVLRNVANTAAPLAASSEEMLNAGDQHAASSTLYQSDEGSKDNAGLISHQKATVTAPEGLHVGPIHLSKNQTLVSGIAAILIFGVGLGCAIPSKKDPHPWNYISSIIGWWYFMAWSISFLPQLYLNWQRKCVVGQSFDYVFLNVLGFTAYSIYNICFFFVDPVKREYEDRFHDKNDVEANDVAFAVYSFFCVVLNTYQIIIYERGSQRINKLVLAAIAVVVLILTLWGLLLFAVHKTVVFNTLDWLYGLSMVKLGVTIIKYLPQVYLNYKRKLTVGWNIWNVLLDFTGGSLSVVQALIDAGTTDNWSAISGNLAKFMLGCMSMVYDVVFMIQHYVLYRENNARLHAQEAVDVHRSE